MALEDLTGLTKYIDALVNTNPTSSDPKSEGDNHLQGIKNVLLNTFASITGAVTATQTELNKLAGFVGAIPALGSAQEWTRQQNFNMTTLSIVASAVDWDMNLNQVAELTLTGNVTINAPTNIKGGATYILILKQDATGGRTVTWDSIFKWPYGEIPALSTGINDINILSFVADDTGNLYGTALVDMS